MDFSVYQAEISRALTDYVPNLVAALGVLILGWVVAWILSRLVYRGLKKTSIDNRIAAWVSDSDGEDIQIEKWVARAIFLFLMLFVLIGFLQVLGLGVVREPVTRFTNQIVAFLPRLIPPIVLLLVAWLLATGLRLAVRKSLNMLKLDERLGAQAGLEKDVPLAHRLGDAVYWLVFLLFLPAILGALGLQGLLVPVQNLLDSLLAYLPKILGAGLILLVGWFVAKIIQRVASGLVSAVGIDGLGEKIGLDQALGEKKLSDLLGLLLYVLVLIPVIISSLNALELDAITQPASNMLRQILDTLPALFAATLILLIAYYVGRAVSGLVANLLSGVGFDALPAKLGLSAAAPGEGKRSLSELAGTILLAAVMLLAVVQAFNTLGLSELSTVVQSLTLLAGRILLGVIIFGVGLFLADLAARAIRAGAGAKSALLATLARTGVLLLTGAMALREMGLADDIINLAFGLTLGAVAIAAALAFGLGGREAAARRLGEWENRLK